MAEQERREKRRAPRAAKGSRQGARGRAARMERKPALRRARRGAARGTAQSGAVRQQIVVSGVGGQGVLFVGRLLAEAAMARGLSVLASETHGMAQRGGTVIAHLKVGSFSSPLVRPGCADVLILLKEENAAAHGSYLRAGGWAAVNATRAPEALSGAAARLVDADALARASGLGKAVNLIVLGRALAGPLPGPLPGGRDGPGLFCTPDEIRAVLRSRMAGQDKLLEASVAALEIGIAQTKPERP